MSTRQTARPSPLRMPNLRVVGTSSRSAGASGKLGSSSPFAPTFALFPSGFGSWSLSTPSSSRSTSPTSKFLPLPSSDDTGDGLPSPASGCPRKNSDPDFLSSPSPSALLFPSLVQKNASGHTRSRVLPKSKWNQYIFGGLVFVFVFGYFALSNRGELGSDAAPRRAGVRTKTASARYEYSATRQRNVHCAGAACAPPLVLTPVQELSALLLFLAAGDENILPSDVNPDVPLDPNYVLSYALPTEPESRAQLLAEIERESTEVSPVVLIGRAGDVWTRQAKEILMDEEYLGKAAKSLGVVLVNGRPDSHILTPLLARLTQTAELPIILVGGQPIGSYDQLKALHDERSLGDVLAHAGATIGEESKARRVRERKKAYAARKPAVRKEEA